MFKENRLINALPTSRSDLEKQKFVDDGSGNTAVRAVIVSGGGGGGGATGYDATVGSTGDYADIQAAITGVGGTDIKLLLLEDITEDSDIAVPSGANLVIDLSSYTLTMADYQFTYTGAANVSVFGNGRASGAEIDWTPTAGQDLFINASYVASVTEIKDLKLDNNATAANAAVSGAIEKVNNITFELPNLADCGFKPAADGSIYDNIEFIGGGSACKNIINPTLSKEFIVSNILLTGTFQTGADVMVLYGDVVASNILYTGSASIRFALRSGEIVMNNFNSNAGAVEIYFNGLDDSSLSNFYLKGGTLDIGSGEGLNITNGHGIATLDMTDTGASNCNFTNLTVTNNPSIRGDGHKFTNVNFLGGATAYAGVSDSGFVNCQFGADAGGGSNTLTIQSGANRTRVGFCMTDAAISDSGTDTEAFGNTIY